MDEQSVQLKPDFEFPRGGAAKGSSLDQHSEEHWPGGLNKMTLELAKTQGKKAKVGKCKTKVGPCWRSFIQGKLSRGSHKSHNRVRNAKSRNITPV